MAGQSVLMHIFNLPTLSRFESPNDRSGQLMQYEIGGRYRASLFPSLGFGEVEPTQKLLLIGVDSVSIF
ncbi:MAG: hypothetical protein AAGC93_27410 [Cyanobacteria bacterium P01_F01_bin.53]